MCARLKPLKPVSVEGPKIGQCRGIIAGIISNYKQTLIVQNPNSQLISSPEPKIQVSLSNPISCAIHILLTLNPTARFNSNKTGYV